MMDYKKELARILAQTGALFFDEGLILKDGRPTPYFVNMAMFRTGRLILEIGAVLAHMMSTKGLLENIDIILGPSYKGSAIALATAIAIWKDYGEDFQFEYDRKEAKTHGEASITKEIFVNRTFFNGCRIFIVDDVATSMGTKIELLDKIETEADNLGITCRIHGVGILIDREQTTAVYDDSGKIVLGRKGKNAIQEFTSKSGMPVYSAAGIREVIEYLYKEKMPVLIRGKRKPIDDKTKREFDEYMKMYGINDSIR